jgi:hypothetical protein
MTIGPDGALYVANEFGNSVSRFDATTGAPLPAPGKSGAEFVSSGSGGLDEARMLAFGPYGDLYVVSEMSREVLRYDGTTGNYESTLVTSGSGGLHHPKGLLFHEGYLYVTCNRDIEGGLDAILRFDAITGDPAGISGQTGDAVFIPDGDHGLDNPGQIIFHDGFLYVASTAPPTKNAIVKYTTDGTWVEDVVPTGSGGLFGPTDMEFSSDGYLYVVSWANDKVIRYDTTTGTSDVVAEGAGLDTPVDIILESDGTFIVTSRETNQIRRYGPKSQAAFTISLSQPSSETVSVEYQTSDSSALAGQDYVATSGTLTFAPGQMSRTIVAATLDNSALEPNETFSVVLSNPQGAVIADGTGIVTILDDDAKFYVVNDAAADSTFRYDGGGSSGASSTLASTNTAPRGAASTAAGDRVWVVDVNKTVYVYNAGGGLLGSWTAGGLHAAAQVEGIATNATDVWIVDAKSDKVYRYAGAASRLSGSQNAISSFSLNSANKNPKDIVTNGEHLWVVDDSSTDKVFKYTVSGTLAGSWTISSGGGSPTGITIDPTNVSEIWVVDSATDRVYQFTAAASRTSGSQSPAGSFTLAAGNTNPQGIADPPAVSSQVVTPAAALRGDLASLNESADRHSPTVDRQAARSHGQAKLRMALDFVFSGDEEFGSRRLRKGVRSLV